MKKIKHICFITYGYPSKKRPYYYTFVDKLVSCFRDLNIKCTVIYPVPLLPENIKNSPPEYWTKETSSGNKIEIYSPKYLYFWTKKIGVINTGILTANSFENAVKRIIEKHKIVPDCFYGHFIFPAGYTAARLGKKYSIPSFFAYGESSPWSIKILGLNRLVKELNSISGVVAVSTAKKNELLKFNLIKSELIKVFPNAVDHKQFYPRSKEKMRKKYGFPQDAFIIGYTGNFTESKGVLRVVEAVNKLQNNNIKLVLIGGGKLNPRSENIIFKGRLPHDEVPLMLSTCDIFVLPTKNEGLSNAIVEAMACGLPVISSAKEFNYDILTKENSILIDPDNIDEISESINFLINSDEDRKKLASGALKTAKELSIEKRAQLILEWMEKRV